MKRLIFTTFALMVLNMAGAFAEPWNDPSIFSENRLPMSATFTTEQQMKVSLRGMWKFHLNPSPEGRLQGFEAPSYDDASWGEIPVPGLWELNGWLDPMYLNIGYPWRGHYNNNPPYPPLERNCVGDYRRSFDIPASWEGKQVCLFIGSATSNVRVWVNGKEAGYSEDSKLEARFDITPTATPRSPSSSATSSPWKCSAGVTAPTSKTRTSGASPVSPATPMFTPGRRKGWRT